MTFSLVEALVNIITTVLQTIGLPGLFALMVVESFGLPPIPSEVILPFTGFLVAEGVYGFAPAVATAVAGGLVGAFLAYAVGRWGRERITGLGIGHLRIAPNHLERMDRFFARRGEITVAIARMIPFARAYVSYPAGTARMNPVRFGVFTAVGSVPFAVLLIYAGIVLRSHWDLIEQQFAVLDDVLVVGLVAVVLYFVLVAMGWIRPKFIEPTVATESEPPPSA
jgi:membrane protein DedA with SNARE-associated domain